MRDTGPSGAPARGPWERAFTAESAAALHKRLRDGPGTLAVLGGGLTGIERAAEVAESHPGWQVRLLTGGVIGIPGRRVPPGRCHPAGGQVVGGTRPWRTRPLSLSRPTRPTRYSRSGFPLPYSHLSNSPVRSTSVRSWQKAMNSFASAVR